jgi:hypothetical protein
MIIFKRLPDGTWEKSGAILPTETHYRIAVDAENPERMIDTCAHAIQEVENRIKQGTTNYRFELAMPPTSLMEAARRAGDKTVKRILDNAEPMPKSGKPIKAATKSKGKKETGKQRRARLIREHKCTCCGKRAPRKGRRECKDCADYQSKWTKARAKKGKR